MNKVLKSMSFMTEVGVGINIVQPNQNQTLKLFHY